MESFDVIIIGAGPAGAVTGFLLAKAGLNVKRGQSAGSKNVSGGLLYTKPLQKFLSNFSGDLPVERAITTHKIVMLGEDASVSLDYHNATSTLTQYNAFSVREQSLIPGWQKRQKM